MDNKNNQVALVNSKKIITLDCISTYQIPDGNWKVEKGSDYKATIAIENITSFQESTRVSGVLTIVADKLYETNKMSYEDLKQMVDIIIRQDLLENL
jgi:hypothetical protein